MDRNEFEKANGFREEKSCLTCWWVSMFREKTPEGVPYKPTTWYCRLMREQGVPEAESVVKNPGDYVCRRYEE
jgi:hypothetical protein